ncbi:isochorismatase family protein [Gordonia shandongensis]|uniref:isochorismatase family protein n=1 Tax=Gordonia shandongensis TaxID=376351 RepID=UPI0003FB82AC|nr:isochorismatase family protein [Gordonia shandongensis]
MSLPESVVYDIPRRECVDVVDWSIDPDRAVLLIHDMQDHFVRAFDRESEPLRTVIPNIASVRADARARGVPVVYTAQPGDQDPVERALLTDFWGPGLAASDERIIDDLTPADDDIRLVKWRYSAFARSDLAERMRMWGRDQLIIVGVYAHIGVMTTALDAFMRDVRPHVVRDAVADFSEADHARAMDYVATRCGRVETTVAVREALR